MERYGLSVTGKTRGDKPVVVVTEIGRLRIGRPAYRQLGTMRIIHHESFIDTQSSYMFGIHIENHERLRLSGIRPRLRFSEYISIPPIDIGYRPSPETIDGKRVIILETIGYNLGYRFG